MRIYLLLTTLLGFAAQAEVPPRCAGVNGEFVTYVGCQLTGHDGRLMDEGAVDFSQRAQNLVAIGKGPIVKIDFIRSSENGDSYSVNFDGLQLFVPIGKVPPGCPQGNAIVDVRRDGRHLLCHTRYEFHED